MRIVYIAAGIAEVLHTDMAASWYFWSISNPMNLDIPKFLQAIAVVPIPIKGSQTTMSGLMPCSLMHISGNFVGNGEG